VGLCDVLAAHAAKGKTAVADIKTFGCFWRRCRLGFGNQYKTFPVGKRAFAIFYHPAMQKEQAARNWPRRFNHL